MSTINTNPPADALASLRIRRDNESRRPSVLGRLFQVVFILLLLAAVGIGSVYGLQRSGWLSAQADWIPEAIRSRVEVRVTKAVVEKGRAADAIVVATGYLKSYRQANIGARAAGRIEAVNVEEGSRVKLGDVIAVLDHKDIDAALAAVKAAHARSKAELGEQEVEIARAKSEFDRTAKLRTTNAISESEHEQNDFRHQAAVAKRATLAAAVELAWARVQEAEQFRENMIVRAPFDGTVISKDAEVGESILPGGMGEASGRGSVVTIADLERLEVECDVKEDFIGRVLSDYPTEVAVDAVPGKRYQGRVRKVIPMGNRARATIKVKVAVIDADARLFPDMSATVFFLPQPGAEAAVVTDKPRVFCDTKAIVNEGDAAYVWQLDGESRLSKVEVTAGRERDGRTEILSGLAGGERLIISPPDDLQSGQTVKLRE